MHLAALVSVWLAGCAVTVDRNQEGFPCDAGNVCSHGLECIEGVCQRASADPCAAVSCDAGEVCESGACVPDGTATCDPPCTDEETCIDGICVPPSGGCDPECSEGESCVEDQCLPDVCEPECEADQICEGGACVPIPCDPECGENEICDAGLCVSTICDPECGETEVCDIGTCRPLTCDDVTCAGNERCVDGQCLPRCRIGNTWYDPLAPHPTSPCLHCDPDQSTADWSPRPEGTSCGEDLACADQICDDGGACIEAAHDPGTVCDEKAFCDETAICLEGCWIEDALREPMEPHESEPCLVCDPDRALDAWSTDEVSPACLPPDDCGDIVTFETGLAPSQEIFVSPEGDDALGDGSEQSPFASVNRAAVDAAPGTAIRLLPGTYGDQVVVGLAGTPSAPIWIGGRPGADRPRIAGGGTGLLAVETRWLVVHDLDISGMSNYGIHADDGEKADDPESSRGLILRNVGITDIGASSGACVKFVGIYDFFILDSVFERCGSSDGSGTGTGIDVTGGHGGLIARNDVGYMDTGGIRIKGGSADVELRGNRIYWAGRRPVELGGAAGTIYFHPPASETDPNAEVRDLRMIGNLVRGGETGVAFVGCVSCLVANNTLVDPTRWLMRILPGTDSDETYTFLPTQDGLFVNNLVYFERAEVGTDVNISAEGVAPETFRFEHNLWYAWDEPAASQPDLPGTEENGIAGEAPLLYETDDSLPGLWDGSPAIGAGRSLDEAVADIRGVCWADPPSIGAWEGAE